MIRDIVKRALCRNTQILKLMQLSDEEKVRVYKKDPTILDNFEDLILPDELALELIRCNLSHVQYFSLLVKPTFLTSKCILHHVG